MQRIFQWSSLLVVAAVLVAGCERKATVETKETKTGPGGTTTTTVTKTVESTGDNPPPNSAGEAVPPK
jgi:hypothetical protein